jgi:hypothetical protein
MFNVITRKIGSTDQRIIAQRHMFCEAEEYASAMTRNGWMCWVEEGEPNDQDAYDIFLFCSSKGMPEPTAEQLCQFISLSLDRYGFHPCDLQTDVAEALVEEILS